MDPNSISVAVLKVQIAETHLLDLAQVCPAQYRKCLSAIEALEDARTLLGGILRDPCILKKGDD